MWINQLDVAKRCVFLFPDFTYDEHKVINNSWMFHLRHKTIPHAAIRVETNVAGKLVFAPSWPSINGHTFSDDTISSVSVSSNRKNDAITADVTKRLLTPYFAALPVQVGLMKRASESREDLTRTIVDFYELLEQKPPTNFDGDTFNPYNYEVRTLQFGPGGKTVRLETFHLPVEVAKEVCELLKRRVSKK